MLKGHATDAYLRMYNLEMGKLVGYRCASLVTSAHTPPSLAAPHPNRRLMRMPHRSPAHVYPTYWRELAVSMCRVMRFQVAQHMQGMLHLTTPLLSNICALVRSDSMRNWLPSNELGSVPLAHRTLP